ncbi:PAQR family membrane homeostasis protein TrhA [Roseovarius aestuariivivens]|uniref:PAQR family membrane homeostasis protein TrhA n=1 Tax=Roseovarius aestuariivivens TaxID=1888910 RepID=UPI0010822EA5|nr:hemolysin III family protein [Roseovarius aestuariivivens]
MSYPAYSRAERIADGVVHVVGVSAALAGVVVLFAMIADQLPWSTFWAAMVYALALVTMLSASAAYHLAAHTSARPLLRRIDHAAIYVKIAGTLTPLGVLLGSLSGYVILCLIWALALTGAVFKLRAAPGKMSTGWLPQVALGWLGLVLLIPLWPNLPRESVFLIITGGMIYTGAVVFYCWESLRYANAIWHAFVLAATACTFLGITSALAAPPAF